MRGTSPAPRRCSCARSSRRSRARASRSWRTSRCARPAGSSTRRKHPATSRSISDRCTGSECSRTGPRSASRREPLLVSNGAASRPATVAVNLGGGALVPQVQDVLGDGEVVVSIDDERARDAEILLVLSRDRATMEPSVVPSVRWLHAFATGVDSYPLDVIGDRLFTCSRGANAVAIAEFVLATMLAFAKRLPDTWLTDAPENWGTAQLDVLAGRTLGLLGVGAIGTEVAKRAAAFDMRVVAFRRSAVAHEMPQIELLPTLEEMLGTSDHVVIAAPATPET